jgi:hypothetical protein
MILLKELLLEKLTFRQLLSLSDEGRQQRSRNISVKPLKVTAESDSESWTFSYKGSPSTTKKRHQGYIKFLKSEENPQKQALDWNCIVDCTCPDYKYRFAYNNTKQDAGVIGSESWNKNSGQSPLPINKMSGLCKHLISLTDYLKTKIDAKRKQLSEGKIKDYAIERLRQLPIIIDKLEKEYDALDDKSLNTQDVQKKLISAREELNDLRNLEL